MDDRKFKLYNLMKKTNPLQWVSEMPKKKKAFAINLTFISSRVPFGTQHRCVLVVNSRRKKRNMKFGWSPVIITHFDVLSGGGDSEGKVIQSTLFKLGRDSTESLTAF